jgi:DNA-binding transcriptional MerR regulator
LERELTASNTIIRQQQLLDEENLRLKERIKRLEEALAAYLDLLGTDGVEQGVAVVRGMKDRIKRLEEQNYTLRARLYATRPRIPIEKKLAIADAPQNISISELARKFDVSYGTVARYRRKAKEAKL